MGKKGWNQATGGYGGALAIRLSEVKLPNMIKCGRCGKNKHPPQFSTKQLTEFRYKVYHEGQKHPTVNCRNCAGGQVVELECIQCNKVKGLEDFAKAQRSNPDYAKCMACMEKHLALTPIDEDRYEGGDSTAAPVAKVLNEEKNQLEYFDDPYAGSSVASENGDASYGGGVALNREMEKLKLADMNSRTTSESSGPLPTKIGAGYETSETSMNSSTTGSITGASTEGDDGWMIAGAKSSRGTSVQGSLQTGSVAVSSPYRGGFDPTRYGHPGARSTGPSSDAGSIHSTATEQAPTAGGTIGGRKFAKIKAFRPPSPIEDWKSEDEGDDKGDYDSDSDFDI